MTSARDLVASAANIQRSLWVAYVIALGLFYWSAWRAASVTHGIGLQIWESAETAVYAAAVLSGLGALLLRHSIYQRATEARAALLREACGVMAGPSVPTAAGLAAPPEELEMRPLVPGLSGFAATETPTPGLNRLRLELLELSRRERSVWTLSVGPTVLGLPCALLSGDLQPLLPLTAASLVLLVVTFPRTAGFAHDLADGAGLGDLS